MSAPLVINLRDGSVWERRAVTAVGVALYALAGSCSCPEFVMATEAELAALGIAGAADVLPVPVDGGPVVRPLAVHEAQLAALVASGNRAVNDVIHEDLCACDAWPGECLSSGGFFPGCWDWGDLETAVPAVLGLWERMRGSELERLRARVAELEASPLAFADRLDAKSLDNFLISLSSATEHEPMDEAIGRIHELLRWYREAVPVVEESADKLTRLLAPTQALREDEPTDSPCSKCGDPVHWVTSTNTDGGYWRHRLVPGRALDHFGEVAGAEGPHGFEKEYQGVGDAKRRLARCKHCGQDRNAPMHVRSGESR